MKISLKLAYGHPSRVCHLREFTVIFKVLGDTLSIVYEFRDSRFFRGWRSGAAPPTKRSWRLLNLHSLESENSPGNWRILGDRH
jgi:hypothetical protein